MMFYITKTNNMSKHINYNLKRTIFKNKKSKIIDCKQKTIKSSHMDLAVSIFLILFSHGLFFLPPGEHGEQASGSKKKTN